jgi:glycosyltransferase involved in cell wall biosynthesis
MISAIVLTKNEEKNIVDCLESLLWCDEILVIDDNSEDKTVQIIEKLKNKKIKVLSHPLDGNFSKQRNFALQQAQYEWVLFIDADERVSLSLEYEILSLINSSLSDFSGYYLNRRDVLWRKELKFGETGSIKLLRLVKKEKGEWVGKVHESLRIRGKTGFLRNPLTHYPHQDITQFLKEINFYTDLRAKELFDKKTKVYWWIIIIYPLGKFILNYGIKRGFLDGLHGLVFAILMSLHSFLVRGKLWQLWQKK